MNKPPFKYDLESAFVPYAEHVLALRPSGLYRLDAEDEAAASNFHVYAVCTRPRIRVTVDPVLDGSLWRYELASTTGDSLTVEVDGLHSTDPDEPWLSATDFDLRVSQGGSYVEYWRGGELLVGVPLAAVIADGAPDPLAEDRADWDALLDLEVEYVGQAFGAAGERGAVDRLREHPTLQKILSEISDQRPDLEAILVLFAFNAYTTVSAFGGWAGTHPKSTEEQVAQILDEDHSLEVVTDVAEACMIRYFHPAYNQTYKATFPQRDHAILRTMYSRDINSVGFEVETTGIGSRLYTGTVPPSWHHAPSFPLHSRADRRAMFDFFTGSAPDFVFDPDE